MAASFPAASFGVTNAQAFGRPLHGRLIKHFQLARNTFRKDKSMARTKKDDTLKQQKRVTVRFTETEYDTLQAKAKAVHLPIATFVHDAVLGKRIEISYDLSPSIPELAALTSSFGKTASNLNQIARHLNEKGNLTDEIVADIRRGIQEIFAMRDGLDSLKSSVKD